MKAERLHALADAYGADLRRWPASERAFAETLIAADPSVKAVRTRATGAGRRRKPPPGRATVPPSSSVSFTRPWGYIRQGQTQCAASARQ